MAVCGVTRGRVVTEMGDFLSFMVYAITVIVILSGYLYGMKRETNHE